MIATKLAHVLFDEAHSQAWTIDPTRAQAMQPAHPGDASYALAAGRCAERDFDVAAHREGPLDAETLAAADVLVLAHPSDPRLGAHHGHRLAASGRGRARRDRGVRARRRRPGRDGGDRAGEVRQQPQRAAGAASRCASRTTPCRTTSTTAARRAGSWPTCGPARAGARAICSPACARPACTAPPRSAPRNGARVLARTHATASTPSAPLIVTAKARRRARRRARRLRPVRRRLHRRARPPRALAEPRSTGRPAPRRRAAHAAALGAAADALADPRLGELRDADQRAGGPAERRRLAGRRRPRPAHAPRRGDRRSARARWRRTSPTRTEYLDAARHRPAPLGAERLRQRPTSPPRWRRSGPSASARDGI